MTDNEIIQALRHCGEDKPCETCPVQLDEDERVCVGVLFKHAATAIERLTAENAALREKVPQWISVEDRLPPPGARVLITDGVFVGEAFLCGKIFSVCGEIAQWRRYHNVPWKDSMKTEITHWMPLPGAPEEGDKHE